MLVAESGDALERFLKVRGIDPGDSPIVEIGRAALDFYASVPAEGVVPLEEDGDMFLYQWGRSQWSPRPDDFSVDFVRQFVVSIPDDEEPDNPEIEYFQLHCTLWMPAGPFASIANDHCWLYRPEEAAGFAARLVAHPVMVATQGHRQIAHEIAFEQV